MKHFLLSVAIGGAVLTASAGGDLLHAPQLPQQRLNLSQVNAMRHVHSRVQASGEWSEWAAFGTGTLTMDDMFALFTGLDEWQGDFPGITVDERHDLNDPTQIQYRLNGAFNNAEIIVNFDANTNLLVMEPQNTHIDMDGDELMGADLASCYRSISNPEDLGMTQEEFDEVVDYYASYNYAIPVMGRWYIYMGFYPDWLDDLIAMSDVQFQFDGYPDFKPVFEAPRYVGDQPAAATVTFDPAASMARVASCKGLPRTLDLQAILAGDVPCTDIDASGEVALDPSEGPGLYTLVGITCDLQSGQALDWSYTLYTYTPGEADKWDTIGTARVVNNVLEPFLGCVANHEVEIQKSVDTANPAYRLVNPFGDSFTESVAYDGTLAPEGSCNHYLTFDVSNPERVLFETAHLGLNVDGEDFYALSTAAYLIAMGQDEEETLSTYAGSFNGNCISMPSRSITLGCTDWTKFGEEPDMLVATNLNGEFRIELPEENSVNGLGSSGDDVRWLNLQGLPVEHPAAGQLLIRLSGAKAVKTMTK